MRGGGAGHVEISGSTGPPWRDYLRSTSPRTAFDHSTSRGPFFTSEYLACCRLVSFPFGGFFAFCLTDALRADRGNVSLRSFRAPAETLR